jgi:hypothetical protein
VSRRTDQPEIRTATTAISFPSFGSLLAAALELLPLIGPADDRSPMWSDAPRSVGSVGTTNRMVVPMTVMVRICLVNSHSPIGTDASGSVDSIDTGGCVARLGEHERAKCNHDGEHRCAISGDAQHRSFHFGYLLVTGARMISSLLYNENPGHDDRGFCPYSISRCREMHHLRWETTRCGLSMSTPS